jgi:DNA replication protein DnaC
MAQRTPTPRVATGSRADDRAAEWRCPYDECDGSGFVIDPETDAAYDCRCRAERRARTRARRVDTTIPRRFRGLSFDREPLPSIARAYPAAVAAARRYCERIDDRLDTGEGAAFLGTVGTGKTTLAMVIAAHAVRAERSVAVYATHRLLDEIRATFNPDSHISTVALVDRISSVDLLVLDDIGVPKPTEWALETLYSIVNTRYEDERSIVFTANVEPSDASGYINPMSLSASLGERTISRLLQIAGEFIEPMVGIDQRQVYPAATPERASA